MESTCARQSKPESRCCANYLISMKTAIFVRAVRYSEDELFCIIQGELDTRYRKYGSA